MSSEAKSDDAENPSERRLEALESRVAHQDQTIQDLSQELFAQQRQLEQLQRQTRLLAQRLEEARHGVADAATDERPPHY